MHIKENKIKLFKGLIYHKRHGIIEHTFENQILSIFIDLTSINNNKFIKNPILFSINKLNIFSWLSKDHGLRLKNTKIIDIESFIIKLLNISVKEKNNITNIKLLTFPKVLGFGFSPLSVYFCYNDNNQILHSVFEVKNTFGDIHHYIMKDIPKKGDKQKVLKKLFVSPFYNNNGYYHLMVSHYNNKISTSVEYIMNEKTIFYASMKLKEIKFNNFNILNGIFNLLTYPGKIWMNIHYQALILWFKKLPINNIPQGQVIKYSNAAKISKSKN